MDDDFKTDEERKRECQFSLFDQAEREAEREWVGMPEFVQEDLMPFRTIKIHFRNDEDIQNFGELINQRITKKTRFIWFSGNEKLIAKDKMWVSE